MPAQLFMGSRPIQPLRAVENHDHRTKPGRGGLWTADWQADIGSAWAWGCASEFDNKYQVGKGWLLHPDPRALVYVLDGMQDLRWLQRRYSRYPDTPYEDGFYWPGSDSDHRIWWPTLAWPAIARAYDAVRLTDDGWRALGENQGPLRDWAVPSTVWFHWCFLDEPIEVHWLPVEESLLLTPRLG
jgi:hypothetical protein